MKSIFHLAIAAFFLTTGLVACNNDDETGRCDGSPREFTSLEAEYGCANTQNAMGIGIENDFTIISTQFWFDSLVTGFCNPIIDFDTYDLIIGRQTLSNGVDGINYSYRRACPTRRYELRVTFTLNDATVAPTVTYHILVPKIADDEAVDVLIETN
ncbi:MAG: hypothetical protein ABR572_04100 [Cryomorphaceae bacterium]